MTFDNSKLRLLDIWLTLNSDFNLKSIIQWKKKSYKNVAKHHKSTNFYFVGRVTYSYIKEITS